MVLAAVEGFAPDGGTNDIDSVHLGEVAVVVMFFLIPGILGGQEDWSLPGYVGTTRVHHAVFGEGGVEDLDHLDDVVYRVSAWIPMSELKPVWFVAAEVLGPEGSEGRGCPLVPGEGVDDKCGVGVASTRVCFKVGVEHCHCGAVPSGW